MSRKPLIFVTFNLGLALSLAALTLSMYGGFVSGSLGWLGLLGLVGMNIVGSAIGLFAIRLELTDRFVGKGITQYIYFALMALTVLLFLTPIGLGIYAYLLTSLTAIQIAVTVLAWLQGGAIMAALAQLS